MGIVRNSFRVAVVDDEEVIHLLIQHILQRSQEFSCVGCFSNATDALVGLPSLDPDLVLMDVRMPCVNGIDCTRRLKRIMPGLKIITMSGLDDADSINESLQAGAIWYLYKHLTTDYFLFNLRVGGCVATGMIGRSSASELVSPVAHATEHGVQLTNREIEVLELLAKGLPYKETADKLGISLSTVHWHANSAYRKLHVTNRTEAVRELRARA